VSAVAAAFAALALVPFTPAVEWRDSVSHGSWWDGRLAAGVQVPAEGRTFFTWDPVLRRSPNREWRRYGSDRLVRLVLRVLDDFRAAHPEAPRIGIGDLSRPGGGDFGVRFGRPGHVSHQNGLDADLYYPRRDGKERPPRRPSQIDRRLSKDLVNRFVRAGAVRVFVGPRTGLRGPSSVVQVLAHHDNHLHVRIAAQPPLMLGRSHEGRPVRAWRVGNPRSPRKILVVGCIHGDECAGMAVTRRLLNLVRPIAADLWVVQSLNPDGFARRTRYNARGVDLNRNFPSEWRHTRFSGARPLSEREARVAYNLIVRIRPDVTIWFHQPQALVRAWGPSIPAARRYARLAGERYRSIRWPNGTAPNWQNHRFPGAASFVVELPAGELSDRAARRHLDAILGLAPKASLATPTSGSAALPTSRLSSPTDRSGFPHGR
jgi:hypothetical protein